MTRITTLAVAAVLIAGIPFGSDALAALTHTDPNAPCFRWPAVDMDGDGVFDRVDHCVNTTKGCTVDAYGCETDEDGDGVCDGLDRCPGTPPNTEVDASGCSPNAPPPRRTPPPPPPPAPEPPQRPMEKQLLETGRIRLENVYFETESSRLLPESETALREAAETLERYPQLRIEIQGHTDTRGRASYNMKLSQTRAESVREFMLRSSRLDGDHLVAKGYGETEPETHERNDEELFRNRRVELHVLNPEALPKQVKIENR